MLLWLIRSATSFRGCGISTRACATHRMACVDCCSSVQIWIGPCDGGYDPIAARAILKLLSPNEVIGPKAGSRVLRSGSWNHKPEEPASRQLQQEQP